jgi:hypothetical protein
LSLAPEERRASQCERVVSAVATLVAILNLLWSGTAVNKGGFRTGQRNKVPFMVHSLAEA